MTGLSPQNDRIIEIATVVTDIHLGIVAQGPELKAACGRFGITAQIEESGGVLLSGVCFLPDVCKGVGRGQWWMRIPI